MKTLFSLVAPLSLLVLALACGGEATPTVLPTPTASPAPAATPTPIPQGFLEVFKRSVERFDDLTSYRASMTMETKVMRQTALMDIDMEVSQGSQIHLSMEIGIGGAAQTIAAIFVPPHLYARVPGAGWLRLNSEALAGMRGNFAELLDDPLGFRGALYPSDAESITPDIYRIVGVSREATDGLETDHLQIEIEFQKLLRTLSEAQVEEYFGVFLGGENLFPEAMDTLSQIRSPTLEAWIDDNGYTRKLVLEMKAGDVYSTLVEMRIFDVNEVIAIDPPQEFDVVPE